jgi:hypothetical protein
MGIDGYRAIGKVEVVDGIGIPGIGENDLKKTPILKNGCFF